MSYFSPALIASFLATASAFGQGSAPLGLEWGMPRPVVAARISTQARPTFEKVAHVDSYENARLGEFSGCGVDLRFANDQLASVAFEMPGSGPGWLERVKRLTEVFSRSYGNPLDREIDLKSLGDGIKMAWTIKNDGGRSVDVVLTANLNHLHLAFSDSERADRLADRPRLSLSPW